MQMIYKFLYIILIFDSDLLLDNELKIRFYYNFFYFYYYYYYIIKKCEIVNTEKKEKKGTRK